ncbi:MAG: formylglycine-generating enzyme family protein [Acidobacteriota bacterium]
MSRKKQGRAGGAPLSWASRSGEDEHGLFAALELEDVEQTLRWIPDGTFPFGVGRNPVTLTRGFWLADTPCTQALWEVVTGSNPSKWKEPERPVERVSWDDCQVFLGALNDRLPGLAARLPSEAEWERAAWGEELDGDVSDEDLIDDHAWWVGNSGLTTHPVGEKEPGCWGLHDMAGNVEEWCVDGYQRRFRRGPRVDPVVEYDGGSHIIKGGWWISPRGCGDPTWRNAAGPDYRAESTGFRIARSLDAFD